MGLTVWSKDHCVEWWDTQHRDMAGCSPLYPAAFRRFLSLIIASVPRIASNFWKLQKKISPHFRRGISFSRVFCTKSRST